MATQSSSLTTTLERIRARTARVGVIGLGYVGLPLAVEFAHAGFDVTGFDVDGQRQTDVAQTDDATRAVRARWSAPWWPP